MDALSFTAIMVTIVFWASAFAGIRAGLEAFSPAHLTLYRFLVASAALAVYALARRLPPPAPPDLLRIFGLSLLGITTYHLALNSGEVSVPAGTASLIIAAGPVITAVLTTLFRGERLTALGWLGTLVSFGGVALIVLGRGESVEFTRGALLILLAALVTSLYFVFQRDVVRRVGALRFTVYSLMLGTLPLLVFLPGFGTELARAPLDAHLAVIYIGLFPAALAYITWTYALSRVDTNRTTSFLYVSPVLAILIGWLWLGEIPARLSLVGGAIALAGVVLVNTLGRPRPTPTPEGKTA
jgi:drug/metabolite transporter (DMT)-like permease